MITDILTIIWKEFKELFHQRGRFRGGLVGVLVFVFAFGVLMPLQTGPDWIESPLNLVFWAWLPYLLVSGIVADTIAGERERHTLETLLASRLSDRAILFGKIGSAVAYSWGLTLINVLIGIVTVNVAFPSEGVLLFPLETMLAILGISFLVALFGAGLGVAISLRASTVRQAQQTMSVLMLVVLVPMLILPFLPEEWAVVAIEWVAGADLEAIMIVLIVLLILLDAGLLAFALSRFKRARLILD